MNEEANVLLKAINVKGYYSMSNGDVKAVDGCSLKIYEGEIVGIAGESGCGKSTLGKILMGYTKPPLHLVDGHVYIDNIDIYGMPLNKRREIWGSLITMVPQYSMNSLNPTKKISDFIFDTMKEHLSNITKENVLKKAELRFKELGLSQNVLNMYPFELSGGMKQRVVVAVSTLLNPKVLICDEPTSALDVSSQRLLLELLYKIVKNKIVKSMIIISHDIATLRQISDYIYIMYAGKIVESAPTELLIKNPLHPYTKYLVGSVLTPEPRIRKQRLKGIPGIPPNLLDPPKGCRFYERCPYSVEKCKYKDPPLFKTNTRRYVACWLYKEGD